MSWKYVGIANGWMEQGQIRQGKDSVVGYKTSIVALNV